MAATGDNMSSGQVPSRISVIGCPGTGKSTLATELGAALQLPVFHLDRLFWRPGWKEADEAGFLRDVQNIVAQDRWIIDGNYSRTMPLRFPRSHAIIWLDLSMTAALWGVLRRYAHSRGRARPDMADGCNERWDWGFIKWVLTFPARQRNRQRIEEWGSHARLIHIRQRRQRADLARRLSLMG
jgi:adenylate kinase family enzyme